MSAAHNDSSLLKNLAEKLRCAQSQEPLVEPVTLSCCGHTFNKRVLTARYQGLNYGQQPSCPKCNERLPLINNLSIDIAVQDLINTTTLARNSKEQDEQLRKLPDTLKDHLSDVIYMELMCRPSTLPCGHSVELESIAQFNNSICPFCRKAFIRHPLQPINKLLEECIVLTVEHYDLYAEQFFPKTFFLNEVRAGNDNNYLLSQEAYAKRQHLVKLLFRKKITNDSSYLHEAYDNTGTILSKIEAEVRRGNKFLTQYQEAITNSLQISLQVKDLLYVSPLGESLLNLFILDKQILLALHALYRPEQDINLWPDIIIAVREHTTNEEQQQFSQTLLNRAVAGNDIAFIRLLFKMLPINGAKAAELLLKRKDIIPSLLTFTEHNQTPLIHTLTCSEQGLNFLLSINEHIGLAKIINRHLINRTYSRRTIAANLVNSHQGRYMLAISPALVELIDVRALFKNDQELRTIWHSLFILTTSLTGFKILSSSHQFTSLIPPEAWLHEKPNQASPLLNILNSGAAHAILAMPLGFEQIITPSMLNYIKSGQLSIAEKLLITPEGRKFLNFNPHLLSAIKPKALTSKRIKSLANTEEGRELFSKGLHRAISAPSLNESDQGIASAHYLLNSPSGIALFSNNPQLITLLSKETLLQQVFKTEQALQPVNAVQLLLQSAAGQSLLQQHYALWRDLLGDYQQGNFTADEKIMLNRLIPNRVTEGFIAKATNKQLKAELQELKSKLRASNAQLLSIAANQRLKPRTAVTSAGLDTTLLRAREEYNSMHAANCELKRKLEAQNQQLPQLQEHIAANEKIIAELKAAKARQEQVLSLVNQTVAPTILYYRKQQALVLQQLRDVLQEKSALLALRNGQLTMELAQQKPKSS